jgi:hypothetical protein
MVNDELVPEEDYDAFIIPDEANVLMIHLTHRGECRHSSLAMRCSTRIAIVLTTKNTAAPRIPAGIS